MRKSLLHRIGWVVALLAATSSSRADVKHRLGSLNHWFTLQPGEHVRVTITFSSTRRIRVTIFDHATGRPLKSFDSSSGDGPELWISATNHGSIGQTLAIESSYASALSKGDWQPSDSKVLNNGEVGFEAGDDADFNDAKVHIAKEHAGLRGVWYLNGDASLPCLLVQHADGSIVLVNEHGGRTTATLTESGELVAHQSGEWTPTITAMLDSTGALKWSSNVAWMRTPRQGSPSGLCGVWYLNGDASLPCLLIQRPDNSIILINEHGGATTGTLLATGELLAHPSPDWGSVKGKFEGHKGPLSWQSLVTWEREPRR